MLHHYYITPSVPTESSTEGRESVFIGVGVSVGVLLVIIATAIVITISVTVWLKRKNKLMTTTDNVAYGVNSKEMELSDNVAYSRPLFLELTLMKHIMTMCLYTNTRNDIISRTSPNEAYGATVADDLAKK